MISALYSTADAQRGLSAHLSMRGSTEYSMASLFLRGENGGGSHSLLMRHLCFRRSDRYMVQFCGVMVERWLMPRIRSCTQLTAGQCICSDLRTQQHKSYMVAQMHACPHHIFVR